MTRAKGASILSRWKRWGISLNVDPATDPCSVEQLLIDTAIELDANARLFVLAVTWLVQHHPIVDVERLAELGLRLRGDASARLGLLLDTAQKWIGDPVFDKAIGSCYPAETPKPLFAVEAKRPSLAKLAEKTASQASRRWGLWTQSLDRMKTESIRPASWIAKHNQTYTLRWLFKGDVRSRVVTALMEEGQTDLCEADLTRMKGCTRKAMHAALSNLTDAGLIKRTRHGRRYVIGLA
ncbi:MAG: hypothetical protein ACOCZE_00350 [Planctomycetota bacterium]